MNEYWTPQTDPEFQNFLKDIHPRTVADLQEKAKEADFDHERMCTIMHWLVDNERLPVGDMSRRRDYEDESMEIAKRLETHGDLEQVDEIIERYEDLVSVGGLPRG